MTRTPSQQEAYSRRCGLTAGCRHDHWHRPDIALIIRSHIPSITARIEEAEIDSPAWDFDGEYIGDRRECACGVPLDGFYEYVDHLIAVFGGESHLGG
jgi:hypothetical protein